MGEQKRTGHEAYQEERLTLYKWATKLPDSATLIDVIKALVEIHHFNQATEMLFGCKWEQVANDRTGRTIYMSLWSGELFELIKVIAENHRWTSNRPNNGCVAIEVYPGEYFVIPKVIVTELHRLHLL